MPKLAVPPAAPETLAVEAVIKSPLLGMVPPPSPVPVSWTVAGNTLPFPLMTRVPDREPAKVGENVTEYVEFLPGATSDWHPLFEMAKSVPPPFVAIAGGYMIRFWLESLLV